MYDEFGNLIDPGTVDLAQQIAQQEQNYTYTPPTPQELQQWATGTGVTDTTGTAGTTGTSWAASDIGRILQQILGGAASATTGGTGGGLGSIGGLLGGAGMVAMLYNRMREQEARTNALRSQVAYTPAPQYARQLQAPIYGRGGIGETLHFNPIPFQYDAAQAAQQSNMPVPTDLSRPKPTPTPYTQIPTRAAEQPQYISELLSKFQSPVSMAPQAPAASPLPTMAQSVSPYAVKKANGGPIYDKPDEELGYTRGGIAGMLHGDGDGMSDHIPATIQGKQPARLSDGEFVIPADVVSHLGNGSSKAGADRLYKMMDKIRKERTGRTEQAKQINPNKYLPG